MTNKRSLVLLIDDNIGFAREYSETLQSSCGAHVIYATTASEALELVKKEPIKIAIIDQVMPVKGTELFKQIKKIDPYIRTILLTAEAGRRDLTDAANMGFDYTLLKEDEDMDSLPSKILILLSKYNAQKFDHSKPIYCKKQRLLFAKKPPVNYYIEHYETIDDKYADPDGWITRDIVEKGESLTYEEEFNFDVDFNYTESFKINNEASLGISISQLSDFKNSLSTQMASDFSNTYTESLKRILKRKKILDLPKDQQDIVSRVYEYTKVYHQIKVYIRKECSCCNEQSITPITVNLPIPIIRYRIIEHFADGTKKEINSGEITA